MEKESEVVECMALSFYTMTNLENTKAARFFRKLSTYFYVIVYSLMMVSMVLGTLNKEEYPELMDLMNLIPHQNIFLSVLDCWYWTTISDSRLDLCKSRLGVTFS